MYNHGINRLQLTPRNWVRDLLISHSFLQFPFQTTVLEFNQTACSLFTELTERTIKSSQQFSLNEKMTPKSGTDENCVWRPIEQNLEPFKMFFLFISVSYDGDFSSLVVLGLNVNNRIHVVSASLHRHSIQLSSPVIIKL